MTTFYSPTHTIILNPNSINYQELSNYSNLIKLPKPNSLLDALGSNKILDGLKITSYSFNDSSLYSTLSKGTIYLDGDCIDVTSSSNLSSTVYAYIPFTKVNDYTLIYNSSTLDIDPSEQYLELVSLDNLDNPFPIYVDVNNSSTTSNTVKSFTPIPINATHLMYRYYPMSKDNQNHKAYVFASYAREYEPHKTPQLNLNLYTNQSVEYFLDNPYQYILIAVFDYTTNSADTKITSFTQYHAASVNINGATYKLHPHTDFRALIGKKID